MDIQTVGPNEFLSIDGPASIRVMNGRLYVLGVEYGSGDSFTVMRGRRIIAKSLNDSKIDVVLGPEGKIEKVDGNNEVIDVWDRALSAIPLRNSTIIILGAMDVGKTTVTTILVNKGVRENLRVGVIDGDPGQNDIGPPTTISASIATSFITHLTQLRNLRSVFVKTTSIEHVWNYVLDSISRLIDDLKHNYNADTIVINTDGWVSDSTAIKFKLEIVKRANASHIIVIKRNDEVDELLKELSSLARNVIVIPSPPNARIRDRDDRKIRREMGYSKYLMPSRELSINLRERPIINLPLFNGLKYDNYIISLIRRSLNLPIHYIEQWGNAAVAIGNVKEFQVRNLGDVNIAILPENWESGLLVALEDKNNYLLSLGILRKIYYNTGKAVVSVHESFNNENMIDHIRLGMIRVNDNYEEIEKVLYIGKVESLLSSQIILKR
ncbi:GTPase or GTP-binding protein K06947 [Vulcanisaeta moutnovskia 768-28]|uniref:polynucleotide 5'-hydroxyl-kinase n=1 Tax=Vulcanisaeta moutnovskia (strain 768-28) TaxID=985053 RepID=F0QX25_VULM7|nr:Clp1/GlmU family protein [Vulcanisaeta moutnovskia]ADY02314.1 GTPase or GTP-binding protein K06947 [Vulcanisaeta moutnovskia 768-28]